MKCALSLLAECAIHQKENEEKARIAREEAKVKFTISICEKLGSDLEERARLGKKLEVSASLLKKDGYWSFWRADGRYSYSSYGKDLLFDVMKEWFNQYCFDIEVREWEHSYDIKIFPIPACFGGLTKAPKSDIIKTQNERR